MTRTLASLSWRSADPHDVVERPCDHTATSSCLFNIGGASDSDHLQSRGHSRAGSTGAGRDFDEIPQFLVQVVEKTVEIPQLPRDPQDKSLT